MGVVRTLWRILTHTKALDQSCGKLETVFFESVYRVMYITGQSSSDRDIGYIVYSTLVKLMIIFIISGEVWFGFTESSSLDEIAATINVVVIQFITVFRYKNRMDHKPFYKKLAESMDSINFDVSTEKRKKLVKTWAQRNERYLKLLLALGNCTLAAWFIFPLLDDIEYNLIIGIRLPFYYKTPARYPYAYILVVISFGYISHFVMVTDLIMQAHLIHLLCQFNVLADCFENSLNDCSVGFDGITKYDLVYNKNFADKYTKRLGNLVEQHKLILSHTSILRNILSGPMLGQLAASGTLICFVGYQAATTIGTNVVEGLMSFLFLGYNAFELYIICKWCEEITNWSQKIGKAIYCSGWECGVYKIRGVRSTIMFVIARANKPVLLTAGGMYNISIASYATVSITLILLFKYSESDRRDVDPTYGMNGHKEANR
ncbi:odorant receptor 94a-like [Anticarsia gemmatalis]|uniref:odorant receptor 94a-like n=1 Tax=Anticarsia gemmatalis TaxID=129554 RepID=UPI003F770091